MIASWTDQDTTRAQQIWAEYQQNHDVSDKIGQAVGIDPVSGRVWFGESGIDIRKQLDEEGIDRPLFFVPLGTTSIFAREAGGDCRYGSTDGEPIILLPVGGKAWRAVIDTGFNGDLELPVSLKPFLNPCWNGLGVSILAGGQSVLEENYIVDFPFDGQIMQAEATFVPSSVILVGTRLMRRYHLEINFVAETVRLERVSGH